MAKEKSLLKQLNMDKLKDSASSVPRSTYTIRLRDDVRTCLDRHLIDLNLNKTSRSKFIEILIINELKNVGKWQGPDED